jgi:hypothetical protein
MNTENQTLNAEVPALGTWNLTLGPYPAVNHAGSVTILSHAADTGRLQKSHTIDGVLRQSWGIFLAGAGKSVPSGHRDLSHMAPF